VAEGDQGSTGASTAWATSGMMSLAGRADGPTLDPPEALIVGARAFADEISIRSSRMGRRVLVDPLSVMAERAALTGLRQRGAVSCGGTTRLMRCDDGWIAASMSRPTDWDLVAALLEFASPVQFGDWAALEAGVADLSGGDLRSRSELLGIPLAVLGERRASAEGCPGSPGMVPGIRFRRIRSTSGASDCQELVVADLSALWAGPLVGRLLRLSGANVVKIESMSRVDGARQGSPAFYELLNGSKASVALDFGTEDGRRQLRQIVSQADVVITASRPRALEQLGLDAESLILNERTKVWLMISGYGHAENSRNRVAFGDDAAVAGGLVVWDELGPCFCGDAIADPLTGLAASAAVFSALESDGEWIIEASMADIAGGLTGPALSVDGLQPAPPFTSRSPSKPSASTLGADTARVLAELGIA
jgi:crotonobetainyl-CoA:carnitine CoA-transferase CaiB-like acyl-CoA transferase